MQIFKETSRLLLVSRAFFLREDWAVTFRLSVKKKRTLLSPYPHSRNLS